MESGDSRTSPATACGRYLRCAGLALGWHGVDEQGRDTFDYLSGEVGHYPLSEQVRSDRALISAARLLRSLHDASVPLTEMSLPWQFPAIEPVEVVCHGDFAPYNCVFEDGMTAGAIDFDGARPAPRRWDLAYALYRFAPLTGPANRDRFGDSTEQARRARLFLDSYGCALHERADVLRTVGPRLLSLVEWMRSAAAAGDVNVARHIECGHADLYLSDIDYTDSQLSQWVEILHRDAEF